jgi:uncharacterized protein (TIGR00266 family)
MQHPENNPVIFHPHRFVKVDRVVYNLAMPKYKILYGETYPALRVDLAVGEGIIAESTTLMGMTPSIQVETRVRGGQIKAYITEPKDTFFINTYRAVTAQGRVILATRKIGELNLHKVSSEGLLIIVSSFVAGDDTVSIQPAWRGTSSFQTDPGLSMLRVGGTGEIAISSFGKIHTIPLKTGETYAVDRGHLLGLSETVQVRVRGVGGVKTALITGKEMLIECEGPGNVYLQTRSEENFLKWIQNRMDSSDSK